jgi:endoglucanase
VIVGEYGLLGYDASENCLQTGEELKYYEYMNEMARQYNVCLMFWDNGSGIDRTDTDDYSWKKAEVGAMLEASMTGRSSYTTGLDTLYFDGEVTEDVAIPLTLNGNTFYGIEGLVEGTDYTYDEASATITLSKDYINKCFAAKEGYGTFAKLVMKFSSGADWTETLVKYTTPVAGEAVGTTSGIDIPVTFNGSQVRRVTAYQASGKVGPNSSWWDYLQNGGSFNVDYNNGTISLTESFFSDDTVSDGIMMLTVEFYDGQVLSIWLNVDGDTVTTSPDLAQEIDNIDASMIICLYAGETEIPSQYIYAPEGTTVYGTWTSDSSIVAMSGWPASMTFDTVAHDDFIMGGIVLYYMNAENYITVYFGIKDAPTVDAISVKEGERAAAVVSNLEEDAVVSYEIADSSIASVDADGKVTGVKAGTTTLIVTVTQYNRTDSFKAEITVTEKEKTNAGNQNNKDKNNKDQNGLPGADGNQENQNKLQGANSNQENQNVVAGAGATSNGTTAGTASNGTTAGTASNGTTAGTTAGTKSNGTTAGTTAETKSNETTAGTDASVEPAEEEAPANLDEEEEAPEEPVDLDEEETPLASLDQGGEEAVTQSSHTVMIVIGAIAVILLGFLAFLFAKKQKEE